jgi:mRNA interferase HigB
MVCALMRVIARSALRAFWNQHSETRAPLEKWYVLARPSTWSSMDDIRRVAPKAKVLNGERARFEVAGGNYRLVVAFDFPRQIAFIKFLGTHAEYDRVDALTISMY